MTEFSFDQTKSVSLCKDSNLRPQGREKDLTTVLLILEADTAAIISLQLETLDPPDN